MYILTSSSSSFFPREGPRRQSFLLSIRKNSLGSTCKKQIKKVTTFEENALKAGCLTLFCKN